MQEPVGSFESISQRVAYSYIRSLAGEEPGVDASVYGLHSFFEALYESLYDCPARFGLPQLEDDCIRDNEPDRTKKLAGLNRKLQRPRDMITAGLTYLMRIGQAGELVTQPRDQYLKLDAGSYAALVKETKVKKPFLFGLAGVGLEIEERGSSVEIRSQRFPGMLFPLKGLALACGQAEDEKMGLFNFARCDFKANNPHYVPSAPDLFRVFDAGDCERAVRLHEYFIARGYKPIYQIYGIFGWEVRYQGKRQVKSTPLMEIEYSDRFQQSMRIKIKCASTRRIAPLLSQQPRSLQQDFFQRTFTCGDCGWCRNKTTVGPSVIEFEGVQKRACWYVTPEIREFNDEAVALVQQYTVLHEALA